MGAIDCENLELLTIYVTHPAGNIRSFPIPRIRDWVSISRQACLSFRKLGDRAKREPGFVARPPLSDHGGKKVAHHRDRQHKADGAVKKEAELHQHPASRKSIR